MAEANVQDLDLRIGWGKKLNIRGNKAFMALFPDGCKVDWNTVAGQVTFVLTNRTSGGRIYTDKRQKGEDRGTLVINRNATVEGFAQFGSATPERVVPMPGRALRVVMPKQLPPINETIHKGKTATPKPKQQSLQDLAALVAHPGAQATADAQQAAQESTLPADLPRHVVEQPATPEPVTPPAAEPAAEQPAAEPAAEQPAPASVAAEQAQPVAQATELPAPDYAALLRTVSTAELLQAVAVVNAAKAQRGAGLHLLVQPDGQLTALQPLQAQP